MKPHRNGRRSRRGIIQLLFIILVSLVSALLGLYLGVASSHHHEH
jgi:hypothetical protein